MCENTVGVLLTVLASSGMWCEAMLLAAEGPAEDAKRVRSFQVELPNQENNVIRQSWPGIGCWFWAKPEFEPEGYKRFVDLQYRHSAFRLLTTSIRFPVEVTDPKVHDQIKLAAAYAREHDMAIVMDLDVRLARKAFMDKYPDELQEILRLREVELKDAGEVSFTIESIGFGDHYTFAAPPYHPVSGRLVRVYSYTGSAQGLDPDSVQDITPRCKAVEATAKGVKVLIPCGEKDKGRTACVMAAFSLFTPDVFAPHLAEFERDILRQYADVALAGACKDEWGFPGSFAPRTDDLWFSRFMAQAYAERRPGHDLARDMLPMHRKEKSHEKERQAAINHYLEMSWQRNGELETSYYKAIKEVFGTAAMAATHPTWFPFPNDKEIRKNGLDWWVCRRDLAQTDESTPFCVRTALAKKWHSPLWYNMYYDRTIASYEKDIWRHALGGGRMNFHPLYPHPEGGATSLLHGGLLRADCRIRLLNYISTAPIDCPVAVIFGHPCALNWAGPAFADVGIGLTDALWQAGFYADLIPSDEIPSGHLRVGEDGSIQYGPQRYAAAVLYHPEFERPPMAEFFRKAAQGKTALCRVGDWRTDFEGHAFDGNAALPPETRAFGDAGACAQYVIQHLRASGVEPQTPSERHASAGFAASAMPKGSGQCRLLDGTRILASGEKEVSGDPIQRTITVNGREVTFDAVGVAAVRLGKDGKLEAMAAGGLKLFKGGEVTIELTDRADVALWRDKDGRWQGVLQGYDGPVPEALAKVTRLWTRLSLPVRLEAP